jgi:hypothetical protein
MTFYFKFKLYNNIIKLNSILLVTYHVVQLAHSWWWWGDGGGGVYTSHGLYILIMSIWSQKVKNSVTLISCVTQQACESPCYKTQKTVCDCDIYYMLQK